MLFVIGTSSVPEITPTKNLFVEHRHIVCDKGFEIHIFRIPRNTAHKAEQDNYKPVLFALPVIHHTLSFLLYKDLI